MLNERPAHRCGVLRPKRHVTIALVDEVVHLLGDHIGAFTNSPKHTQVFEHGGFDQAEVRQRRLTSKDLVEREPPRRLLWE